MRLASTRVGEFEKLGYTVEVACSCGQRRTINARSLVMLLGADFEMDVFGQDLFQRKLRCSKCGRRRPPFRVNGAGEIGP